MITGIGSLVIAIVIAVMLFLYLRIWETLGRIEKSTKKLLELIEKKEVKE